MSDNKHFEIKLDVLLDTVNANGCIYPKEVFEKALAKNKTFPVTLNNEVIGSAEIISNTNGIDAVAYISLNQDLISTDGQ